MKREFKEILIKLFIKDSERFRKRNEEINKWHAERMKKINENYRIKIQQIASESKIKREKRNREIKANNEIIKKELINLKTEAKKGIVSIKMGIRRPSISKSIKARTTAKAKRKLNSTINPLYGQKGMGWVNNPKRALYNKTYHKTTFSSKKLFK